MSLGFFWENKTRKDVIVELFWDRGGVYHHGLRGYWCDCVGN